MAAAIGLRKDFDAMALRRLARRLKDGGQARRLLALAEIYEGGSRSEAAQLGGVTLQSIRDWVLRFNIGLVLPWCDTEAMNAHLAEIGAAVDPGACRSHR